MEKSLIVNNKVKLNPLAFEPCEINLDSNVNYGVIDLVTRKSILENILVDELLEASISMVDGLIPCFENGNIAELKEKFTIVGNTLKLAWSANLRCRTFIMAAFTNNKISFRQHVLDRCWGQKLSKQYLKGTGLATPDLFGDIPESFAKRLEINSDSHKTYVLKPKFARANVGVSRARGSGRAGIKRSASFNYQPSKRFAPNFNVSPPNRPVNSVSLPKTSVNSQFFRGHKGYPKRFPNKRGRR